MSNVVIDQEKAELVRQIIRMEHSLIAQGIPEEEVHRVLVSHFSEVQQPADEWPPKILGLDNVPEVNPYQIFDTGYPPVLPDPMDSKKDEQYHNDTKLYEPYLYQEAFVESDHPRDADGKFAGKGGSGSHKTSVKIGKNVTPEHLNQIERIWNMLDTEDRSLVDNLTVKASKSNQRSITVGEWKEKGNTMVLVTHYSLTENDYKHTMSHELGHAKFKQLSDSQKDKWSKLVDDIMPPTHYAKSHRDRIRDYESRWGMGSMNWRRATADEKKIIENNIKLYTNLYHEEIHSEIHSHVNTEGLEAKRVYSQTGLQDALNAFKELYK